MLAERMRAHTVYQSETLCPHLSAHQMNEQSSGRKPNFPKSQLLWGEGEGEGGVGCGRGKHTWSSRASAKILRRKSRLSCHSSISSSLWAELLLTPSRQPLPSHWLGIVGRHGDGLLLRGRG